MGPIGMSSIYANITAQENTPITEATRHWRDCHLFPLELKHAHILQGAHQ